MNHYQAYQKRLAENYIIPVLLPQVSSLAGKSVLDFGCGDGGVTIALADRGANCVGVDNNPCFVDKWPQHERIEWRDTIPPKKFDLIIVNDVVEHVLDLPDLLFRLKRVLKPGGVMYVSTCSWLSPYAGHQQGLAWPWKLIPYLHFVPTYRAWVADLAPVTYFGVSRMLRFAGFRPCYERYYLIPPTVAERYHVPCVSFPGIPLLREVCMGAEMVVRHG